MFTITWRHPTVTLLATLAALGAASALSLGAGTAKADVPAICTEDADTCTAEVSPGLTCTRDVWVFSNSTTCTNTNNAEYTVAETTQCAEGLYPMSSFGPSGTMSTHFVSIDSSIEYDSIFVPANDSVTVPTSTCDLHAETVVFSIAAPAPAPN